MIDCNVVSPMQRRCMDARGLSEPILAFANHLATLGYTPLTIGGYTGSARHFAAWLNKAGIAVSTVDEQTIARFARHDCRCGVGRRHARLSTKYVNRVRRFVHFLIDRGIVESIPSPAKKFVEEPVATFQRWLRDHRGLSDRTIDRHGRMVLRLLPALGRDPGTYDAALVRRVILEEFRQCSPTVVKTMTMGLRGYLRFLAARGACRPGLDQAVPAVPEWRLSTLPRYLAVGKVDQLIASCDLAKPHGVRDRAILLLLARLGLRAGDVLAMKFDDIAWSEGTLRVCGKGRREIRLPLPQDAGDALIAYIERARPDLADERIFLCASAPYRPLQRSSSVSSVVRLALTRAGIADPPSKGAGLLRHSAATGMLRAGATLDAIGAVLRHRSADTTVHYAKVDVPCWRRSLNRGRETRDVGQRSRSLRRAPPLTRIQVPYPVQSPEELRDLRGQARR